MNLTFFPIHFTGLQGIPRKYVDYSDIFLFINKISSLGSLISFFRLLFFILILFDSLLSYRVVIFRIIKIMEGEICYENFFHNNIETLIFFV